jgi:hypothetical protein
MGYLSQPILKISIYFFVSAHLPLKKFRAAANTGRNFEQTRHHGKNLPTNIPIRTNYMRPIRSLEMVIYGSVFLLVTSIILLFPLSTCQAAAFAFSLRLHSALHLTRSTCIDASSTFDGTTSDFDSTTARPPTSTTLP